MSVRDTRRQAALERMADHVLAAGLRGASLRPLAQVAGTSDRMLLYYFTNKGELSPRSLQISPAASSRFSIPPGPQANPCPMKSCLKESSTPCKARK